jgi:hypothetical protein
MLTEISPQHGEVSSAREAVVVNPDLVQADVDRVFALMRQSPGTLSPEVPVAAQGQSDIDRIFDTLPQSPPEEVAELGQNDVDRMFG